ncbi:MAG: sugar transferase [Oscillospiraceae bacterium]|nr:sugar transferase [Oscillospiraceae bacterium]
MGSRNHQRIFNGVNGLLDWLILEFSYLFSVYLRQGIMMGRYSLSVLNEPEYIYLSLAYSTVMVVVFVFFRFYGSYRFRSFYKEATSLVTANGLGVLFLGTTLYLLKLGDFARLQMVFLFVFSMAGLLAKRVVLRWMLRQVRSRGRNTRAVLVVGSGKLALRYVQELEARPYLGYNYRGYLADEPCEEMGRYRGKVEEFRNILQSEKIEEVVVSLPGAEGEQIGMLVSAAGRYSAKISIIPAYNDFIPSNPTVESVASIKMLNVRRAPDKGPVWDFVKRAMDICGSAAGILIGSPILLGAAIAVKFSSPGPIIFKQKRVGKNGREFYMYKFRSMYQDAEQRLAELQDQNEADGPVFKIVNDPRITKVGKFIRRTSIDELPQLFNILKGDMSIVGPRPPLPKEVEQYSDWDWGRLAVRPGLTCYWQISGRSNISFDEWMRLDLQYIEEQGFLTDMRIIFKTVGVVLKGEGAY